MAGSIPAAGTNDRRALARFPRRRNAVSIQADPNSNAYVGGSGTTAAAFVIGYVNPVCVTYERANGLPARSVKFSAEMKAKFVSETR